MCSVITCKPSQVPIYILNIFDYLYGYKEINQWGAQWLHANNGGYIARIILKVINNLAFCLNPLLLHIFIYGK